MIKNQKIPKLTFTIAPNPNGYVIGCNEIPTLFTDVSSLEDIDNTLKNLLFDYIDSFPDDAKKRGVDRYISMQTVWLGKPNSVALE